MKVNIGDKFSFSENNNISYFHDLDFKSNVPSGIVFTVSDIFNPNKASKDRYFNDSFKIRMTADGYGNMSNYGNGCISISWIGLEFAIQSGKAKLENEAILCAAIWCKELESTNDKQLPVNIKEGVVVCGYRHDSCVAIIKCTTGLTAGPKEDGKIGLCVQGFITNKNRFVDRREAFEIAKTARQIKNKDLDNAILAVLYTDDLY